METAGLLVGPMHMRAVSKFVEVAHGALCVMTIGPVLMPEWCADNLDFLQLVRTLVHHILTYLLTVRRIKDYHILEDSC